MAGSDPGHFLCFEFVIARSVSDEAIQTVSAAAVWIASLRSQWRRTL